MFIYEFRHQFVQGRLIPGCCAPHYREPLVARSTELAAATPHGLDMKRKREPNQKPEDTKVATGHHVKKIPTSPLKKAGS